MAIFAEFNADGFLRGLHHGALDSAPPGVVAITETQWRDLVTNQSTRRWDGNKIVAYAPPISTAPSVIYKADIWRRANDAEVADMVAMLAQQTVRRQKIFADAAFLKTDDPDFQILRQAFVLKFGETRTAELLAGSN